MHAQKINDGRLINVYRSRAAAAWLFKHIDYR